MGEGHIVSWFDLQRCSNVIEDDAIGQHTYDFLLVFYTNFTLSALYSQFCAEMSLPGDCDL